MFDFWIGNIVKADVSLAVVDKCFHKLPKVRLVLWIDSELRLHPAGRVSRATRDEGLVRLAPHVRTTSRLDAVRALNPQLDLHRRELLDRKRQIVP